MAPLVSVIVPCYNQEAFIREAVESAFAQTMQDFECLVIDDGSTDRSRQILDGMRAELGERLVLLRHPDGGNHGVSATRNLGLDSAQGEYIAFLDGDDAWLPTKLEKQIKAFRQAGDHVGMVFSDFYDCEDPAGSPPMAAGRLTRRAEFAKIGEMFMGAPGSTLEKMLFTPEGRFFNWVQSPTPLVRRRLFGDGLRFFGPPRLTVQFEDYLMWLLLAARCEFVALAEPLAVYRMHGAQFTSRVNASTPDLMSRIALSGQEQVLRVFLEECSRGTGMQAMARRVWAKMTERVLSRAYNADAILVYFIWQYSWRHGVFWRMSRIRAGWWRERLWGWARRDGHLAGGT
jgi:glycosyltransferase involved in cell wall biosynthesis